MLPPGFSLLAYPPPSAFAASSCAAVVGAVACSAHFAGDLFFSDVSGADQRPSRGRWSAPRKLEKCMRSPFVQRHKTSQREEPGGSSDMLPL